MQWLQFVRVLRVRRRPGFADRRPDTAVTPTRTAAAEDEGPGLGPASGGGSPWQSPEQTSPAPSPSRSRWTCTGERPRLVAPPPPAAPGLGRKGRGSWGGPVGGARAGRGGAVVSSATAQAAAEPARPTSRGPRSVLRPREVGSAGAGAGAAGRGLGPGLLWGTLVPLAQSPPSRPARRGSHPLPVAAAAGERLCPGPRGRSVRCEGCC